MSLAQLLALAFAFLAAQARAALPVLVKDINPGPNSSQFFPGMAMLGGEAYFVADDGANVQLWKSDATSAGTTSSAFAPMNFFNGPPQSFGSLLYFPFAGEPWVSDGTAPGTFQLKDINPGPASSDPATLAYGSGSLYFSADNGTIGPELWKSDGTSLGTVLVKDCQFGPMGPSLAQNSAAFSGGRLYFGASVGADREPWSSDGTGPGTSLLMNIHPGNSSSPAFFTDFNGTVFFNANDGINGFELWKSDGSVSGTVMVKDIDPGPLSGAPFNLTVIAGTLYFVATDALYGAELWKSDGSTTGTARVSDFAPGPQNSIGNVNTGILGILGGIIYLAAEDGSGKTDLWRTDGSAAGTWIVKDFSPSALSFQLYPGNCAVANGKIYFVAREGSTGCELWETDGTDPGTHIVADMAPGLADFNPRNLVLLGSQLLFWADLPSCGSELFSLDTSDPSPTPSFSPSATPSPSPSQSPSETPSPSASETLTPTPSPSSSSSHSATLTASPTRSRTATPSASPSSTPSPTPTPSLTASKSPTPAPPASQTASATASGSPSPSPSLTPSASPSLTPTPLGTASPSPGPSTQAPQGSPGLGAVLPQNPVSGPKANFYFYLNSGAESVVLTLYSSGFNAPSSVQSTGALGPGWAQLELNIEGLANGTYFYRFKASNKGSEEMKSGSLFVLQ